MAIIRGHLSFDAYTQIPNRWVRDPRLSLKAKGALVYVLSHQADYVLSMEQMVRESRDGVDSVYSGLRELEQHGYLQRERHRRKDGTLGETDFRLTEPDQVPSATESQVSTRPGKSRPGKTRRGESGPKKNKGLEEQGLEPPPPSSTEAPRSAAPEGQAEEEAESRSETRTAAGAADAVEVVQGLTWLREPSPTQRSRLLAAVVRCLAAGHSATAITSELKRDLASARNVPEVRVHRADALAGEPPAATASEPLSERPPWCGKCTSDTRRLVEDGDEAHRCPDCNPLAAPRRREANADLSRA